MKVNQTTIGHRNPHALIQVYLTHAAAHQLIVQHHAAFLNAMNPTTIIIRLHSATTPQEAGKAIKDASSASVPVHPEPSVYPAPYYVVVLFQTFSGHQEYKTSYLPFLLSTNTGSPVPTAEFRRIRV